MANSSRRNQYTDLGFLTNKVSATAYAQTGFSEDIRRAEL